MIDLPKGPRDQPIDKGVVTLDLGPNWNPQAGPVGGLAEAQLNQVKAVKGARMLSLI